MTSDAADWGKDPRIGPQVNIHCDHPRHRRRWEVATYLWVTPDFPGGFPDLSFAPGETHDESLCGGHPPEGCSRQWWWIRKSQPSAALKAAAKRKAAGLPSPPGDWGALDAELVLSAGLIDTDLDDTEPVVGWDGHEWRYLHATERPYTPRPPWERRRKRGPYTGVTTVSRPEPRRSPVILWCDHCARMTDAGSPGRVRPLRVSEWRLYALFDHVGAAGIRDIPLRALIRLNSTMNDHEQPPVV